jgi:hypothetical protein
MALVALNYCMQTYDNQWTTLIVNGFISVVVSLAVCSLIVVFNKNLQQQIRSLFKQLFKK